MKFTIKKIDIPLIIGIFIILTMPTLITGYGYEYFFHIKYSFLGSIFYWGLFLVALYCILHILLMVFSNVFGKRLLISKTLQQIGLTGKERVLDLGSGRGTCAVEVAKILTSGNVVSVDNWRRYPMDMAISLAKKEGGAEKIQFSVADPRDLPFREGSFDLVVSHLYIHTLKKETQRKDVLKEMARVLVPGGKLVIIDEEYMVEYRNYLEGLGWKNMTLSKLLWMIFPPVRILVARKPVEKKEGEEEKERE